MIEIKSIKQIEFDNIRHFFDEMSESEYFHPHPFNSEYIEFLRNYNGKDMYYCITDSSKPIAYGILRGWDDGYSEPSLGIFVSNQYRGLGLGKMFMLFLHCSAKINGSSSIILKVYKNNIVAIKIYESLGYTFEDYDQNQLLGKLKIG